MLKHDMTKGNIATHLIRFSIPLILGNMFQLTYNAVDSIIIGKFLGTNSLAAVGAANPVMNVVIFFISGICLGTSILMSEYFGSGDENKFKREFSTAMLVGILFSLGLGVVCWAAVRPILQFTNVLPEIIGESASYLRVIFGGLIFTFLYNMYSSALRSMGDSRTPIYFLILSAVLNIGLDLFFVVGLHTGVEGAAFATVLSQGVSSVLCIVYSTCKVPMLHLKREEIVLDKNLLKDTLQYSWVTALQQTCIYFGKALVQGAVNPLGVNSIAAFNAVTRVDDFVINPEISIGNSMATFIAQNRGAGNQKRIRQGFRTGLAIEVGYWAIVFGIVLASKEWVMGLFVPAEDTQTIALGIIYLKSMAFFYILPALTNALQSTFRGLGYLKITLMASLIQIGVRVICSYILAPRYGIAAISISCFAGWVLMVLYELVCMRYYKKHVVHLEEKD